MNSEKDMEKLLETVTRFDGQVYPKFGWCCILAGGPGSGKGYNLNRYIPIQGRKLDVDEIKAAYIKKIDIVETEFGEHLLTFEDNIHGKTVINLEDEGIKPPYNTNNPQYTGLLHKITSPVGKKIKELIFNSDKYSNKDRLPNVIFDCTMANKVDYDNIIESMYLIGYKIALVYIFTPIDRAINQNKTRGTKNTVDDKGNTIYGRRVDYSLLLDKHNDVFDTLLKIKDDTSLISKVSDAWVILPTDAGSDPKIINIKDGDSLNLNKDELVQFISKNSQDISNRRIDYKLSNDKEKYNEENEIVTGAYDLYEALAELKG